MHGHGCQVGIGKTLLMSSWIGLCGTFNANAETAYLIQPGDVVEVSVWHEADLQKELLVRPDGTITLPLVGQLVAGGQTVKDVQLAVAERLQRFIPDPVVTVGIKQPLGNKVYVIGKVNRPGEFVLNRDVDVMQALSMAAGTARFAELKEIIVLRRTGDEQSVFKFNYEEVQLGQNLGQNIMLRSGDVVVVP